jgi:cephalosporin hydroxylase
MLEARESLSGLLEVCPEHTPAALLLQELAHHAPPSQASSETCAPQSSETTILESADLLLTRALEALQLNDPAAALALVDAAARQQQSTQDLHYVRAICCLKLSRIGEACQALQTELEKFPDNAAAKELLEQVQSEFSPEVAVTSAARSVSHQPSVSSETLVEEEPTAAATATPCNDQLQIVQASTESEVNLGSEQNASQARPNAELRRFQTPEQREARSVLSEEIRCSLQTGTQQYCLGGLQLQKNPFDFALQQRLIDSVRPKSVLDFGASSPASALWYAGVLQALSVDAIVLCGGSFTQAPTQSSALSKVSLRWELSAKPLSERVSPELLKSLPHPWLVRIDLQLPAAERASLLKKLRQELIAEDYLLVESDTLIQPELKDFLASHPGEYEVDTSYCDFFGYNATGCPNGYLRRKSEVLNSTLARPILQDFFQADRTHTTEAPAINQRFQLFYALREEFSRLKKKTWKFLLSMLEHPAAPCSSSSAKPWSSAARNEVPQAIVLGAGSSLGMNLPRK